MKSTLGFGGASLTSMGSYDSIIKLLQKAKDYGIDHFDTAPLYGKGYSEVIYGRFLKSDRSNVSITTKFGLGDHHRTSKIPVQLLLPLNLYAKKIKSLVKSSNNVEEQVNISAQHRVIDKISIESSFKKSIARLKTDYIDYYMLHEALPHSLTDEAKTFLLDLKTKGFVRFLGIAANVNAIRVLEPEDIKDWDVLQYEGFDTNLNRELLKKFETHRHFHHSCLKLVNNMPIHDDIPVYKNAGYLLFQDVVQNPNGKTIFSTRNIQRLNENLSAFSAFSHSSKPAL